MEPVSTFLENRSGTFVSKSQTPPPIERPPSTKPIDPVPIHLFEDLSLTNVPPETTISPTPRVSIPHKVSIEGKHPIKAIYSFLTEARRWAEQTRDITYSNLMLSTEEILQQVPARKAPGTLRKLPDIDSQILIKAAQARLPGEVSQIKYSLLSTETSAVDSFSHA